MKVTKETSYREGAGVGRYEVKRGRSGVRDRVWEEYFFLVHIVGKGGRWNKYFWNKSEKKQEMSGRRRSRSFTDSKGREKTYEYVVVARNSEGEYPSYKEIEENVLSYKRYNRGEQQPPNTTLVRVRYPVSGPPI